MSAEPPVSVVIPVRNGASFVPSAMESITAQEYGNLEVLLIDDGSTDGLAETIAGCPPFVRYIRQEPRGPAAARNRGLHESKSELVAFFDVDDLWTIGSIRRLVHALDTNPAAGIAQGRMRQFLMAPGGKYYWTAPYRMPYLGSCLFRRSVFLQAGTFDESMPLGEDYDLIFRCWEKDIVKVHVEEPSLLYRRHPDNYSRGVNGRAHLLVIKRRIERIKAGVTDPSIPRRDVFQHYIGDLESLGDLPLKEVSEWELRSA